MDKRETYLYRHRGPDVGLLKTILERLLHGRTRPLSESALRIHIATTRVSEHVVDEILASLGWGWKNNMVDGRSSRALVPQHTSESKKVLFGSSRAPAIKPPTLIRTDRIPHIPRVTVKAKKKG